MPAQNPGDPSGVSCLRPVDVRPVVLAAGHRHASTGRSPTRTTTRPATSTSRAPGSTRWSRSASPSRSRARRTSRPAWSSSTTRRSSTAIAYPKIDGASRRPTACGSSTRPTTASGTSSGTWPIPTTGTAQRGRAQPGRARGGPDRPERASRRPTRRQEPGRPGLDPDRHRGRVPPRPAVVDEQQPITWITDPTRFDFGNVDKHSLLLAPAERADVVVDFSKFAGKTLILYNDAPAAFPARVAVLRLLHRRSRT